MARPHAASIVEDAWHRQLDRSLRGRGWANRVVAHTGYGSSRSIRVLARVLLHSDGDPAEVAADLHRASYGGLRSPYLDRRGWRSFVTAPAMAVPVSVQVGNRWAYGRSDRSGHVDLVIDSHGLSPGWHTVTVTARRARPVEVPVFVVADDVRFGLVSDIDDTVITTSLPRPMIAAWNTFVRHERARRVVAGMAPLYRALVAEHPGAPIVYLSTGAWNTAPTLTRFLKTGGFPAGPLLLTDWGPTNTGWFRSGPEHKRTSLHRLARDFPQITWLLVGDDGQHDPAIYTEFAQARPEHVRGIAIRQLTPAEQVLSHGIPVSNEELVGGARARPDSQTPMVYAPDGYGLAELLGRVGLLGSSD
jgi:phosphatidate phosphatase APP1